MTPEHAQRVAMFMRRKAAGLSPNCIEFADELRKAADIIEAAAAPPQPAAVAAPQCRNCRWWVPNSHGPDGECRRFPPVVLADEQLHPLVKPFHWCGEFQPRENT